MSPSSFRDVTDGLADAILGDCTRRERIARLRRR
jgi:hypothetical protein